MSPPRTAPTALLVALVLALSAPARASGPADPLLRLAPPDAGLTLVVEDLRGHARAFFGSRLDNGLRGLPAFQAWQKSDRGQGFQKAKAQIAAILKTDFGSVRDALLGEAFVLTLRTPPGGGPEDARGLLLTRVRDRALLDRTTGLLNQAQVKKGEILRVSERRHGGAVYHRREFRPGSKVDEFYAHLDDGVFAWSNSEDLLRGVLDRRAGGPEGLDGRPGFAEVRRRLPAGAAASLFVDPRFLERVASSSARPPKSPGDERVQALIGRYVAAVSYAGAALTLGDGGRLVLHTEEVVDPAKLSPGMRRWAARTDRAASSFPRVPASALAVASLHADFGVVLDALTSLVPAADRAKLDNLTLALNGVMLGLDLRNEVAPRLGPGLVAYLDRPDPAAGRRGAPLVVEAEIGRGAGGEKVAAALDNALRTILAFYALDEKHGGGKLRVASHAGSGGTVTALEPKSPLAYAVADGRIVLGGTAAAVGRALAMPADPPSGAWFERLRAGLFPGAESFACVDLDSVHAVVSPRREAVARRMAARQNRPEPEAARDLDQALALIALFDAAYFTSAVEPDFTAVHRTLALVPLSPPRP